MQKDKVLHFAGGFAVGLVVGALLHPAIGQAAALLVGWWKEERDGDDPAHHTVDGWDAYWTGVGGAAAQMALAIVQALGWWVAPLLR